MVRNKKIAVFLGDFFWSSIPYDGIPLYNLLSTHFETDLLMFGNDIRLNKEFKSNDTLHKFKLDRNIFRNVPNLKIIKDWGHLYDISSEYEIILTAVHIAPKTRYPLPIENKGRAGQIAQCPVAVWDVGGADILTNARLFADYFFVKGTIWKQWLVKMGHDANKIFVTGSPHYDNYLDEFQPYMVEKILDKEQFYKKYELNDASIKILVMPSNPGAHKDYFHENTVNFKKLYELGAKLNIEFLIKTYPHDYVFHENQSWYSGIYKRIGNVHMPQYDYLKKQFPNAKILDSQDHFSAMKYCDRLFNMSGSHVGWESYFTDIESCSLNYEKQPYYINVSFLPEWIKYPDNFLNCNLKKIEDMLKYIKTEKENCSAYFKKEISIFNIFNSVKTIIKEGV